MKKKSYICKKRKDMNLIVFDCDNTLWSLPYEEDDNFMSTKNSVVDFNFNYIDKTIKKFNEKNLNENNIMVLLTNRFVDTSDEIVYRLYQEQNIKFDYTLFRDKDRDKSNRLKELIIELTKKGVEIENVEFYDDKDKHLDSMIKLKDEYKNITFNLYKIK